MSLPLPLPTDAWPSKEAQHVLADVLSERRRQIDLWGPQDHAPYRWLAILGEEFGEVAKELADAQARPLNRAAYREELIHTAAVAVAAIESLDREPEPDAMAERIEGRTTYEFGGMNAAYDSFMPVD